MMRASSGRPATRLAAIAAFTGLTVAASALITTPAQAATGTTITFTYNSPANPWTAEQVATMQGWAAQATPLITQIYGHPMHSITVNVVQGGSGSYAGEYNPTTDTASLGSFSEDVFIHEEVHAYHDDDIIGMSTWEEGMARAVEIQVATQIQPGYWDASHSYSYDVYYDNVNKPKLGVANGAIVGGGTASLTLLRYEASSYAWTKVMIANPNFLPKLNAAIYANPALARDEAGLIAEAATLQPRVENKAFTTWYAAQGIFNSRVTTGCYLFQRISQYTVDAFCRDQFGVETPAAMTVKWTVRGYTGSVLSSGTGATNPVGWFDVNPAFPAGYSGRIKLTVTANYGGKTLTDVAYRTVGPETGVFGLSTVANTGTVTFASLDGLFKTLTVPVVNGAFSAPSLQTVRGRLKATFTSPTGTVTRYFNKDASAYSLVIKTK